MRGKSILFSIISIITYVGVIFGIVMIVKTQFLLGLVGLLLFIIPVSFQKKAISEAGGKVDGFIAKFGVPIIAAIIGLVAIMAVAFWINL